jgi:NAD(P)-dependent dehydrogenase (short-subunit alcohol dehydrogenase family)
MITLAGRVALVTGASSGIGRATAMLLAAEGAGIVAGARREAELGNLVAEIAAAGGRCVALAGDVRDERYALSLVELAEATYGGLDIAFNNAGILGDVGPTTSISLAAFTETLATNLTSAFLGAKHQVPAMLRRGAGSLIFTSTVVGHTIGFPGTASYSASKSGLIGLTQALASEFGPAGIRVNAILPGAVDTPMYRQMNSSAESQAFMAGLHALKRTGAPEELARAVLFLASDASSFVTGTALAVDGGMSINRT